MNKDEKKDPWQGLTYEKKWVWDHLTESEEEKVAAYSEGYKTYLSQGKTERECVILMVEEAKKQGFIDLQEARNAGKLVPGSKVYMINRGKGLVLAVLGEKPLEAGVQLVGSHIDSPRLDLKPHPLYEDNKMAFFKTHYYGGIKKYQWTTIPLALHGMVVTQDGRTLSVGWGEDPDEGVLTITDLLPHLAKDQMAKKMNEGITGEGLNLLVGSCPVKDQEAKERVKLALLAFLREKYGLIEEDFVSAELEAVPAGPARDIGFDRSLIGGYGQDDRACVYASLQAIFQVQKPQRTALALFVDKEETGSNGNTGMQSVFLENFLAELLDAKGVNNALALKRTLANTIALSADVNAAEDPNYEQVLDKRNAARLGHGVVLTKYTGSGGKYSANDANAELVGWIRSLFNRKGIIWQTGELGKVDQGGGGTIAQFLAVYGMEVIDCGPALLSMHSPFEIASKADLYMTYKAYNVFLNAE